MFKKMLLFFIVAVVLYGCDNIEQSTSDQEKFSTFESALTNFNESAGKNLVFVNTTKGDNLLLAEDNGEFFYVGEVREENAQYISRKITSRLDISTGGGGVEVLLPEAEMNYYIAIKENSMIDSDKQSFFPFSDNKSFQVLSKKDGKTMIESYEKIK
ncbi:hypothetical protein GCM10008983_11600 [Lentibacillus halophilus]|uniref:Lipoprotein n=1 Tax=Lentibacillus halophilus TaxID=295065 RepID=A0ABP3J101_9BACI